MNSKNNQSFLEKSLRNPYKLEESYSILSMDAYLPKLLNFI